MPIPIKWAIIYDTFQVVKGLGEEEFRKAPNDGVLFVLLEDGRIFFDHDYYWYLDGAIDQTDNMGSYLRKIGVKFGRTVSNEEFEAARNIAYRTIKEMLDGH